MPPDERTDDAPKSNLERLRSHLKKGGLADKLAAARIGAGSADPKPALRKVVLDRIEELRRAHEPLSDRET